MQIIPIASGKGGVGKSLVSANLAIALAQSGKRVVLVDLDLGGTTTRGVVEAVTYGNCPQVKVGNMYYDLNKIAAVYGE